MPTRSYYATVPPRTLWRRALRWLRNRRAYAGWTARATTDREVPTGTQGQVLASKWQGRERVHVIGFPGLTLHVPLPWPGIELTRPARSS